MTRMRIHYICEICGKKGSRKYAAGKVPSHFFCSVACQHEWQKTRTDIVAKNKDPEFRKKVSRGLKQRKKRLGDDYHSAATKKKIGEATKRRWDTYDEPVKDKILTTLKQNAQARRKYGPYDYEWKLLSRRIRRNNFCHRCGRRDGIVMHHIIPVREGGKNVWNNLVPLCPHCHGIVEFQQKVLYQFIPDWEIIRVLVRERLHCL